MKSFKLICVLVTIVFFSINTYTQEYHVRIGVIGNSITQGSKLANPATECYSAQLGPMLEEVYGDTCSVINFGLTTTTMLKKGNLPYWESKQFADYMKAAPDICLILLGTNDTKPVNWEVYGYEYIADYLSMIDTIKTVNPATKFMLGYPPPVFVDSWGIRDSIILHGIIPAVDSILKIVDADLVDFYNPLLDSGSKFPDNVHPNVDGARAMAEIFRDRIVETDIVHSVHKNK